MKFLDEKFFFQYFLDLKNIKNVPPGEKENCRSHSEDPSAARGKKQRSLLKK
jgi:hypothetical protein